MDYSSPWGYERTQVALQCPRLPDLNTIITPTAQELKKAVEGKGAGGPDVPLEEQKAAVDALGANFTYEDLEACLPEKGHPAMLTIRRAGDGASGRDAEAPKKKWPEFGDPPDATTRIRRGRPGQKEGMIEQRPELGQIEVEEMMKLPPELVKKPEPAEKTGMEEPQRKKQKPEEEPRQLKKCAHIQINDESAPAEAQKERADECPEPALYNNVAEKYTKQGVDNDVSKRVQKNDGTTAFVKGRMNGMTERSTTTKLGQTSSSTSTITTAGATTAAIESKESSYSHPTLPDGPWFWLGFNIWPTGWQRMVGLCQYCSTYQPPDMLSRKSCGRYAIRMTRYEIVRDDPADTKYQLPSRVTSRPAIMTAAPATRPSTYQEARGWRRSDAVASKGEYSYGYEKQHDVGTPHWELATNSTQVADKNENETELTKDESLTDSTIFVVEHDSSNYREDKNVRVPVPGLEEAPRVEETPGPLCNNRGQFLGRMPTRRRGGRVIQFPDVKWTTIRKQTPANVATHRYHIATADDDAENERRDDDMPYGSQMDEIRYTDVCLFTRVLRKPEKVLRQIPEVVRARGSEVQGLYDAGCLECASWNDADKDRIKPIRTGFVDAIKIDDATGSYKYKSRLVIYGNQMVPFQHLSPYETSHNHMPTWGRFVTPYHLMTLGARIGPTGYGELRRHYMDPHRREGDEVHQRSSHHRSLRIQGGSSMTTWLSFCKMLSLD
eukprot:g37106.t1